MYEMGSFLCTLRIIKYNLTSLETFSKDFEKSGLNFPTKEFLDTVKTLVSRILSTNIKEEGEI